MLDAEPWKWYSPVTGPCRSGGTCYLILRQMSGRNSWSRFLGPLRLHVGIRAPGSMRNFPSARGGRKGGAGVSEV